MFANPELLQHRRSTETTSLFLLRCQEVQLPLLQPSAELGLVSHLYIYIFCEGEFRGQSSRDAVVLKSGIDTSGVYIKLVSREQHVVFKNFQMDVLTQIQSFVDLH